MSYKKLEIWQLAKELSIDIHKMTLAELPSFEKFEEGSQIRRSVKSVRTNIVEGYGRRIYQAEFYKFIVYALSSNDETIDHLEILYESGSLKNKELFEELSSKLVMLGKKLNKFLEAVEKNVAASKRNSSFPESSIQKRVS
jgi:four helix bundle protein